MDSLCKYKDIFGKPDTGLHKYRIFNIAIIDVLFTILGAWLISKWIDKSFGVILVILFLLSIIFHHLFCVKTTVDKLIFGNQG